MGKASPSLPSMPPPTAQSSTHQQRAACAQHGPHPHPNPYPPCHTDSTHTGNVRREGSYIYEEVGSVAAPAALLRPGCSEQNT